MNVRCNDTGSDVIGTAPERSKKVVWTSAQATERYRKAKRSGCPSKLSAMERRILLSEAHKGQKSAGQLSQYLNLPIGKKPVQLILHNMATLKYKKYKRALPLTITHREHCLNTITAFVSLSNSDWRKLIFSDGKQFNFNGLDGLYVVLRAWSRKAREGFISASEKWRLCNDLGLLLLL